MFTLAVPRVTSLGASKRSPRAPRARSASARRRCAARDASSRSAGVRQLRLWLACTAVGSFGFRHLFGWSRRWTPRSWSPSGCSSRGGSRFTNAPGTSRSSRRRSSSFGSGAQRATAELDRGSLRRRMLIDFGLPLVFSCTLSLFSSLGLYRALVGSFGANRQRSARAGRLVRRAGARPRAASSCAPHAICRAP